MVASFALGKDATTTAFFTAAAVAASAVAASATAQQQWQRQRGGLTAEALVRRRYSVDELVPLTFTKH